MSVPSSIFETDHDSLVKVHEGAQYLRLEGVLQWRDVQRFREFLGELKHEFDSKRASEFERQQQKDLSYWTEREREDFLLSERK